MRKFILSAVYSDSTARKQWKQNLSLYGLKYSLLIAYTVYSGDLTNSIDGKLGHLAADFVVSLVRKENAAIRTSLTLKQLELSLLKREGNF